MDYRYLGRTGMEVSVHCLGTMMLGAMGRTTAREGAQVIHAALDHGVNFIDTADMYSDGECEEIVGDALKGRRGDVVLATKGHFPMGEGRNRSGNSRAWLTRAVDDSLRRLKTDWIDLYQVHRPDPATDIEETLSVLTDLRAAGKIRAFGASYFPAEDIVEAWHVADRRGAGRFRTEQPSYSMLTRGVEVAVLPTCRRLGLGVLVSSPLAWGFLSGKYRLGQSVDLTTGRAALLPERFDPSLPGNQTKLEAVERLIEVAGSVDMTLPQLAVAFTGSHPAVSATIVGPRTVEQLLDLIRSTRPLSDEVLERIDEIVPPGTDLYPPNRAIPATLRRKSDRRRAVAADAEAG
jgi:aryl-alcohol dehydrogenase-like predicted oxidoreductase